MLKKNIKFKEPFTNKEVEDEFYFNLTKMEAIEVNLMDDIRSVGKSKDNRRVIQALKRIVRAAVGQKIGEQFVKSEEFANAFIASDAYSELFVEILGGKEPEKKMAKFIKGIVPWADSAEDIDIPTPAEDATVDLDADD